MSKIPSTEQTGIILLAEDNWYLGNEIASLLRYTGHRVIRVEDDLSLLEEARQNRGAIHLLIVDADLPENSGPNMLRRLRDIGDHTQTILLTNAAEPINPSDLDGRTTLLQKPFSREAMIRLIGKLLRCNTDLSGQS